MSAARLHVLAIEAAGQRTDTGWQDGSALRAFLVGLGRAGVPAGQVAFFSAVPPEAPRISPPPPHSLLRGTAVGAALRSRPAGRDALAPQPATRVAIARWLAEAGARLRSGDTLLVVVVGHGTHDDEPDDTRIALLGRGEGLTVRELGAWRASLDPGVRVVALMSQCYAGAFARLASGDERERRAGDFCGYFAATATRAAAPCLAGIGPGQTVPAGHAPSFLGAALGPDGLARAHGLALVESAQPDVPLRTSDVFLERTLARAAQARGRPLAVLVDEQLAAARRRPQDSFGPDLALVDRLSTAFGLPSPRSFLALEEQIRSLEAVVPQSHAHARAWGAGLGDVNQSALGRFLAHQPAWSERLAPERLQTLDENEARKVAAALEDAVAAELRIEKGTWKRLQVLQDRTAAAGALAERLELRLALALRLRTLLLRAAGRSYLASAPAEAERADLRALDACEDVRLPGLSPAAKPAPRRPLPPLEAELRLAAQVVPAWLGIQFGEVPADRQPAGPSLGPGAARVTMVFPESPAASAGIAPGDIVLGTPGEAFAERNQIRTWTALAPIGEPQPLEILRGTERMVVHVALQPYPAKFPTLPGPPAVGTAAPPLRTVPYRGTPPVSLAGNGQHLVFFWATWCGPCKASLPEVMAFTRTRNVPVIAVTDETPEALNEFFQTWKKPFPDTVVIDELRQAFVSYGVDGVPTFVLVDGDGKVASYQSGYLGSLGIPGWRWTADQPAPR